MKIISVVGARPNFMKIAPFILAVESHNAKAAIAATGELRLEHILVHNGQHYDDKMSRAFFEALNIPDADINLNVGSGSHARQVGQTMMAFEKVAQYHKPDWVVVVVDDVERIRQEYRSTLDGGRKPVRPQLWDGQTAPRGLQAILDYGLHT